MITQMSETESVAPPIKKEKKKATEKQIANLKKGMEVLKAKREVLAKERDEFAKKQAAGEVPADAPAPKLEKKPIVKVEKKVVEPPQVITRPRKTGPPKIKVSQELAALRSEISAMRTPAVEKVVEVPVEKVVERVVEKTKTVSGSELLNSIFFK